jgi:diguanylate cyclase (GGDEF)-like protein
MLCPETTSEQAEKVASRIVTAVANHAFATGETHTVSAGVASLASGDNLDNLLQRADKALYTAKQAGRNRVCVIA